MKKYIVRMLCSSLPSFNSIKDYQEGAVLVPRERLKYSFNSIKDYLAAKHPDWPKLKVQLSIPSRIIKISKD